ncbi:transcriptional repressor [Clostridium sp. 'deep sea']|uniref:Fur family transcriptional regulator n=1 Tax=Clostridium sp. 'deep sea' TaxID=2779445 RepID=UPI0018965FD0|nr:transcriptional repressor [Clostridium sp. 'deep sea']QOR35232.1 transcriptional repressor [Clostridium sp. 'deep sea']
MRNIMEKNNIRITNQRRKILEILIENIDTHMSVEDIYNTAKTKNYMIAIPTIYRTMDILAAIGAVTRHDFGEGAAKYEIFIKEKENHCHLVCKNCRKIIEVYGLLPDNLGKRVYEKKGFQSEDCSLKIYGYCKECLSKMKNKQ